MRVSKLGTQHFVHAWRADMCTTAPESAEHLLLKSTILRAVQVAGWNGDVEVCSPDGAGRVDVMATKDSLRVAFEVQLSAIPFSQLAARQAELVHFFPDLRSHGQSRLQTSLRSMLMPQHRPRYNSSCLKADVFRRRLL